MRRNKRKETIKKINISEQLTKALDIPQEIITNLPIITLTGNKEINVENFNNLLEYTKYRIRLNTRSGVLVIEGIELEAKNMTAERICIKGSIIHITFVV